MPRTAVAPRRVQPQQGQHRGQGDDRREQPLPAPAAAIPERRAGPVAAAGRYTKNRPSRASGKSGIETASRTDSNTALAASAPVSTAVCSGSRGIFRSTACGSDFGAVPRRRAMLGLVPIPPLTAT